MKGFAAGLLALLLGLALGLTLVAWQADSSVFEPKSVLAAIPDDTYPALAKNLPDTLGQLTPLTADEKAILAGQIDPGLLRQIVAEAVNSELNYLHGKNNEASISLAPLSNRLKAEGAPLPAQLYTRLDQPVIIQNNGAENTVKPLVGWLDEAKIAGPIAAAVLAVLIWLLGAHYRYRTLAKAALVAVVAVVVSLVIAGIAPSLVSSALGTSAAAALAPTVKTAMTSITHTYTHGLLLPLIILAVAFVILMAAHLVLGRKPRHR